MKIVIPYIDFKGHELKYCLRGIEKYVDTPQVTIIGDKPIWVRNVTYRPFKDNRQDQFRSRNIYEKIMMVDHDFLFFNDDHFLLQPFSADTYHYSGMLSDELNRRNLTDSYRKTIKNTLSVFGDLKNFDTHCPIFYKSEILKQIKVDWTKPQGYCIKSLYCKLAQIEGAEYPDLKIRKPYLLQQEIKRLIEGRAYFSTGDYCFGKSLINVLDELFPEKSKYE